MKETLPITQVSRTGHRHNVGNMVVTDDKIYINLYMFPELKMVVEKCSLDLKLIKDLQNG